MEHIAQRLAAEQLPAAQRRLVWAAQWTLFVSFLVLGLMRLLMPMEELIRIMSWPGAVPAWAVRMIGALEVAGALGVVLPALTGIKPWLTTMAAFGLMVLMICALGFHLMLFQGAMLLPSLALGLLAAYVGVRRL
ncbi:MAG: DoxX family protein [Flavobacteriales bacterium]|nr:DoxX family protein [Flavobacteriales bacterium]